MKKAFIYGNMIIHVNIIWKRIGNRLKKSKIWELLAVIRLCNLKKMTSDDEYNKTEEELEMLNHIHAEIHKSHNCVGYICTNWPSMKGDAATKRKDMHQ